MSRRLAYLLLAFMAARAIYYLVGSSGSNAWQMYHQLTVYAALFSVSYTVRGFGSRWDKTIIRASMLFNLAMSAFYTVGILLLNFFSISASAYVGYLFVGFMVLALTISAYDLRQK